VSEKQSSRNVPDRAPANDPFADGHGLSAGRSADGGGYQDQARAHQAADGMEWSRAEADQVAKPSGSGDDGWWSRGIHAGA
jgi:hypothetical protein